MLKKQIEHYIKKQKESSATGKVDLHKEEKEYAIRHGLADESWIEVDNGQRFVNSYIERGEKETEEFLAEESNEFLGQSISYFMKHKNEFMYMESEWWEMIGADAVSFEKDDVFGTYDVMLGLKIKKKYEGAIKSYLTENLQGESSSYDLMFDSNEGIWSLNFALNGLEGFHEGLTIGDAFDMIYSFLFNLVELIEK